jgi:bacteriocin-like protein
MTMSELNEISEVNINELKDEELATVNGGYTPFHFVKAIFYPGKSETDSGLATNSQAWVISAT